MHRVVPPGITPDMIGQVRRARGESSLPLRARAARVAWLRRLLVH